MTDDLAGWDRDRDGLMAGYGHIDVGHAIEPYDPAKDPVLKGVVADPYGGDGLG